MQDTQKQQVLALLRKFVDPISGKDLIASERIEGLVLSSEGVLSFIFMSSPDSKVIDEQLSKDLKAALISINFITDVKIILSAKTTAKVSGGAQKAQPLSSSRQKGDGKRRPDHVKKIILIASAKGGVGKSSMTVNLAGALDDKGYNVGVLDADAYGPSLPLMFGLRGEKPYTNDDKKIIPLVSENIKLMSLGFLAPADAAVVWRGPMVTSAISQMLFDVVWAEAEAPLDYLLIDSPPGTGDILITLAQRAIIDGVIIVSTPQEAALEDVRRGIAMFDKLEIPILGCIENMAYLDPPFAKSRQYLFGESGVKLLCQKTGLSFLGEIPLLPNIGRFADNGEIASKSDQDIKYIFENICKNI